MEELVEVLVLRQLGLHTRPVVLINVGDFWRPFLQQTAAWPILGFARAGEGALFRVADFAAVALI